MNRLMTWPLAIVLFSAIIASGANLCDNSPCETQINTSLDDEFTISLESYSATGFSWWSDFDPNYLSLVKKTTIGGDEQLGVVGGRERTTLTFSSKSAGQTEIIVLLLRPWENGSIEERKIFPINIISKASGLDQAKVLSEGVKTEVTTIRKSSFQSSSGMDSNFISDGQMNATSYDTSSMDESAMETPSQVITGYASGPYDSSSLSQSRI
jgi:predicted secreted protein